MIHLYFGNTFFQVEQEFKTIRRDVKETKQSLLNKTDSYLQDFEKKVGVQHLLSY